MIKSIALLALPMLAAAQSSGTLSASETQLVEILNGPCVAMIEVIEGGDESEKLICENPNGFHYAVPQVDAAWIEEKRKSGELVSGVTILDLPENTMIDKSTYALILSEEPGLLN